MATLILTHLVPGGVVWVAVDDTLCHKRGAKVAFGGIFLDAVLSSKKYKTLRFGLNWVVLGIAVPIPFRTDRHYCLPVLWRLYRKKGKDGYQTRPQAAAILARKLAQANPDRSFWLVGDSAYINAAVLRDRPTNLQVIGPLHWKAALYDRPGPRQPKQKGASRKKGDRLPNPKAMIEDTATYPAELMTIDFPKQSRELRVQVVRDILWYSGSKTEPVMVVLVRDPLGEWRDEALVATDRDCHGGVRDPGILPEVECGTGVFRQQAVPRVARPPGQERAERGASAPDGVVPRIACDPVVLRGGS